MVQILRTTLIPFDTLQCAKRLQKVGFTEQQAEVQVEIIKEQTTVLNDLINNHLATKIDLNNLEERINERIIASEERTKQRISSMGYKTIVALGSLMIAGITILTYLK